MHVFQERTVSRVPALSFTQTGTVELMNISGSSWPEAHINPEKMASLAIEGSHTGGLEAVRIPYCLTVLSQAMGCEVSMGTGDIQPSIISHPAARNINEIKVPDNLIERGRTSVVLESTILLKETVWDDLPIIVGLEGPATVASHLAGVDNYLIWTMRSTDKLIELLRITTDACIKYANALTDQGADVMVISDGVAGPDLLSPSIFENIMVPEYQRFCRSVKGIKVIHMCGNANPILRSLAACGFDGISVEEKVKDLNYAKSMIGNRVKLIGNISTAGTLLFGSPDNVKSEVFKCLKEGVDVLAPGCGIAPRTPTENIRAFVQARDEYYSQVLR